MKLFSLNILALCSAVLLLTGCASVERIPFPDGGKDYILGVGDKMIIAVYNQEKLSGEFTVNAKGNISLPLIGKVPAAGFTTQALEEKIKSVLKPKYLNDPKVNIQVMNHRNIYILGEVQNPGKYEYEIDMTLPQVVATAGGYTPRASENSATVRRRAQNEILVFDIDDNELVKAGDILIIDRRWF